MTTTRTTRTLLAVLAASTLLAGTAAAAGAPLRMALDVDPGLRVTRKDNLDQSFSRRVATHLVPALEAMGYTVDRVKDAHEAANSGHYQVTMVLSVATKPFFVVHEARQYGKGKILADYSTGVTARGYFRVWNGQTGKLMAHGRIENVESQVHERPGGRPEVDDEESVARVYAETVSRVVSETLARP